MSQITTQKKKLPQNMNAIIFQDLLILAFENCSKFCGCLKIIWSHPKNVLKIKKEKNVHFVFLNKGT
jgi:hypothetical protein